MVFISTQEEKYKKNDSLDSIEGKYVEKENSKEKIKEPWAALDEEQKSKPKIEKTPSGLQSNPPRI